MRVAYITPSISRQAGGLKDSVRREALALSRRGLDVTVHSVEDSDAAADLGDWKSIDVTLSASRGPSRFSYAPDLMRRLMAAEPDVLSTQGLWRYMSMVSRRWHAWTGKPYVVSPHGMLDPWALRNSRLRKRVAARLFEDGHLDRARCLRALCESEADAIRGYGLKNPIAVIPNGVELPDPALSATAPWQGRENFADAKVLLSLGRLHPKKNLLALLRAWKELKTGQVPGFEEWRLVIAGWDEGGYAQQIQECLESLELSPQVWFVGPLFGAQKDEAYRHASAFVIPSVSEGLPMVVLEAWSYGLPVLMTPECNLPEGFAASAALRMETSVESIAEALRQLFALDDSERAAMGRRGRDLCSERFNWSRIGAQTEALLQWMVGAGTRPDFVSE